MSNGRRMMWNGTVRALPLSEQLAAAARARCDALAVTPFDYVGWLGSGITTRDMLTMASDAGVRITHLDPLVRWVDEWKPALAAFPLETISFDQDDFFRMAGALGVESFTAWAGFPAGRYGVPQLVDAFGQLCERAATEGLRCDLEFIAVFGIPDLRTAWAIVEGAGATNSGIVLDLWHYLRGRPDDDLLRTIPGAKITGVQLCDATAELPPDKSMIEDGLNNRRVPGEGDFPVEEIVGILRQTGGLNNVGLEIFSPDFDAMTAEAIGSATARQLDRLL
ncbi:sugar phosphate isomerase/epimerase family protein [Micromonospora sp. 067-2]|uniref:sugar phosphate isomerase/epimerase family protein n=1 Tax=Micromonospora sp. 067-2 TaxID=2789270 RepID=UPI00397AD920